MRVIIQVGLAASLILQMTSNWVGGGVGEEVVNMTNFAQTLLLVDPLAGVEANTYLVQWLTGLLVDWLTGFARHEALPLTRRRLVGWLAGWILAGW